MTKLEELKAAADAAWSAYDVAVAVAARDAADAAYEAAVAAYYAVAAYADELKKQKEKSDD